MGRIVIKCPNTGKTVPTGMGADKKSFESSTYGSNTMHCSACGGFHTWSKEDAWVEE